MTKEKYMALADLQTVWTNSMKPWIVAGFIAITAVAEGATPQLVLQDGTLLPQSTFQAAGNYVLATEKAAANGVATLDENGKVPSAQLPSYVDDVLEAADFASLPAEGEGGKIYVTLDDNKTYRWGGSAYVEISASVALGETTGTAYDGKKGKDLKDAFDQHAADTDIHVTSALQAAWSAKYDKPADGIPTSDLDAATQAAISKANSAVQTVGEGATNGTVAVDGTDVPVHGLGSAAYTPSTDYATAAQGTKADSAIQEVKVNGTALVPDANKSVNVEFEIPERVTAEELAAFVV